MLLAELVATSAQVASTRARSKKIACLAGLLGRLHPAEIPTAVGFLAGRVRQGRIGLGPAAVRDARPPGAAAEPALALAEVDRVFETIAGLSGPGSSGARARLLAELLGRATAEEQDFLARLVVGELRQGALEGLMAEAIAEAAEVPAANVRRALMLAGDLLPVALAALTEGLAGLESFRLQLFRPLQPMLAQPAEGMLDVFDRLDCASLEYKLDGARVQVHRSGQDVRVFSRRLNDVTAAVPELVEAVRALPARELLLDGEVLALSADGSPLPFQVTMRRFGRRRDVEKLREKLPLSTFFFDLLLHDGSEMIDRPADERFAALGGVAPDMLVPRILTAAPAEATEFLRDALRRGHEGVMAKDSRSTYEAGGRGFAWLKVKPSHTLDLVVLAAEWGSGRRRGWLSNLHLGARDPVSGAFVMLGKTFKGMTDKLLAWQTQRLQELEVHRERHTVYVRPELVVEIAFSDVQQSPQYPGGVALRFARLKRYRPDKSADQSDTIETVRAILEGRGPRAELPGSAPESGPPPDDYSLP